MLKTESRHDADYVVIDGTAGMLIWRYPPIQHIMMFTGTFFKSWHSLAEMEISSS